MAGHKIDLGKTLEKFLNEDEKNIREKLKASEANIEKLMIQHEKEVRNTINKDSKMTIKIGNNIVVKDDFADNLTKGYNQVIKKSQEIIKKSMNEINDIVKYAQDTSITIPRVKLSKEDNSKISSLMSNSKNYSTSSPYTQKEQEEQLNKALIDRQKLYNGITRDYSEFTSISSSEPATIKEANDLLNRKLELSTRITKQMTDLQKVESSSIIKNDASHNGSYTNIPQKELYSTVRKNKETGEIAISGFKDPVLKEINNGLNDFNSGLKAFSEKNTVVSPYQYDKVSSTIGSKELQQQAELIVSASDKFGAMRDSAVKNGTVSEESIKEFQNIKTQFQELTTESSKSYEVQKEAAKKAKVEIKEHAKALEVEEKAEKQASNATDKANKKKNSNLGNITNPSAEFYAGKTSTESLTALEMMYSKCDPKNGDYKALDNNLSDLIGYSTSLNAKSSIDALPTEIQTYVNDIIENEKKYKKLAEEINNIIKSSSTSTSNVPQAQEYVESDMSLKDRSALGRELLLKRDNGAVQLNTSKFPKGSTQREKASNVMTSLSSGEINDSVARRKLVAIYLGENEQLIKSNEELGKSASKASTKSKSTEEVPAVKRMEAEANEQLAKSEEDVATAKQETAKVDNKTSSSDSIKGKQEETKANEELASSEQEVVEVKNKRKKKESSTSEVKEKKEETKVNDSLAKSEEGVNGVKGKTSKNKKPSSNDAKEKKEEAKANDDLAKSEQKVVDVKKKSSNKQSDDSSIDNANSKKKEVKANEELASSEQGVTSAKKESTSATKENTASTDENTDAKKKSSSTANNGTSGKSIGLTKQEYVTYENLKGNHDDIISMTDKLGIAEKKVKKFGDTYDKYASLIEQKKIQIITPDEERDLAKYTSDLKKLQTELNNTKYKKSNNYFREINFGGDIQNAKDALLSMANNNINLVQNSVKQDIDNGGTIAKINYLLKQTNGSYKKVYATANKLTNEITMTEKGVVNISTSSQKFLENFRSKIQNLSTYLMTFVSFYKVIGIFNEGIDKIKELDASFVELQKVSNDTNSALEKFQSTSFDIAENIGSTGSTITESAASWEKLGYNIKEAGELAENSALYSNVGDMDIDTATEHMTSTLKAFDIEAKNSISIVDKANEVGNNYAITSSGIGEALERSASSLVAAGNDIDQSIALITAGNIVAQDPESVGNAVKVLSLRIRGAKADLEDLGEETDGLVGSTSKLREEIMSLTGVDLMKDENTFKSTYEIVLEISKVWSSLSDVSQAAVLEKLAGKTRSSVVAGMMQHGEELEEVYKSSVESAGSAEEENARYLDSIQGHLNKMTNEAQKFWSSFIDKQVVKDTVDFGTNAISILDTIIDKLGSVGTLISTIAVGNGIKNSITGGGKPKTYGFNIMLPYFGIPIKHNNKLCINQS